MLSYEARAVVMWVYREVLSSRGWCFGGWKRNQYSSRWLH